MSTFRYSGSAGETGPSILKINFYHFFKMKNQKLSLVADFGYFFDFVLKNVIGRPPGGVIQVISGSAVLYWVYNYLLDINNYRLNFFTLNFFSIVLTSRGRPISRGIKKTFCIKITGLRFTGLCTVEIGV